MFFLSVLLADWLQQYGCFLSIASATSQHFGSREGSVIRKDRRSFDAAVKKTQGIALFIKKRGLICTMVVIGNDPVTIIDGQRKLPQALWLFEMVFSHLIVYCSFIFHNIYRKCLKNVWMKKDKEVRRLWQLLQRYLLLRSRRAMWILCVTLQMPSSATHFIAKLVKLCVLICVQMKLIL